MNAPAEQTGPEVFIHPSLEFVYNEITKTQMLRPKGGAYFTQSLFCEENYYKLLDRVTSYLSQNGFCVERDDRPEAICDKHWTRLEDEASVTIYQSRHDITMGGSGVLLPVINVRRLFGQGRADEKVLPKVIRRGTGAPPNKVEIEYSFLWPATGYYTAEQMAVSLAKKGVRAYSLTIFDELFAVRCRPDISDEVRFDQIDSLLQVTLGEAAEDELFELTKERFKGLWAQLSKDTRRYAITAVGVLKFYEEGQLLLLDASPICLELAKW